MSVLRINQNPIAVNANRNLKVTGMAIAKSLERLSSGLRINRAADDAAGLSISEKLRAQIRGLNRASANALDGISLIQTAEGALDELHTILQRMRELSVQAANGIYSANDRQALQLEITQLTEEINRIANTTEFNTKRLLDGTLGALVSTDDYTKVRAAVTGNVGTGGNFVLRAVAKSTGHLQVQKSDVFTTEMDEDATGQINYLHTWRADATITTAGPDGIGNSGIYQVEVPYSFGVGTPPGQTAVESTTDGLFRISGATGSAGGLSVGRNLQAEELTVGDKIMLTLNTAGGVQNVSITLLSMGTTNAVLATQMSVALGPLVSAAGVAFNATNQFSINFAAASTGIVNTEFADIDGSGSDFYLSFTTTGQSNRFFDSVQVSFFNNSNAYTTNLTRPLGDPGTYFSIGNVGTGTINVRFDVRYDWTQVEGAGFTQSDTISWDKYTGGNSLQKYGRVWQTGPVPVNYTFLVSAVTERTYAVFSLDNQTYTDMVAQGWDQEAAIGAARGAQLGITTSISTTFDGTGTVLENVDIAFDGILQKGETATFNISTNPVLTADQLTTLASMSRFEEFGVFNGRKNVEIEVFLRGTANRATINLSTNDSYEELANKLSLAIWNTEGTGVIQSAIINPELAPDLVHINTIGNAKGTFSIITPVPGAEIVLSGDEAVLKALSLVDVRDSAAPIYSISAFNLETNKSVGSTEVDTNEINGLLPGLKIFFDNTLGLRLDPQPPSNLDGGPNTMTSFAYLKAFERPVISLSGEIETFFMHVAPRQFSLQTGANQGQTIASFIGDHSAEALGVEGLLIVTSELAQEAISIVDVAIDRVSTQRSRLGAIQNRLESTMRNIDVAAENLTASESRIRDTDVAEETVLSTRNQILLQAGVAALAQANQLPQAVLQLLR